MCWYYLSPLWKTLWGFWVLVNGLKGWEVKEGRFLYHLMSTLEQGKTNVRTKVALIVVVDVYHTSLVGFPNANKSRAFAIHSCPPPVHFLFQTLNGIQFVGLDCHLNIYMFFHIFNLAHLLAWCSWHWLLYEIQTRFKELSTMRGFVLLYEFSMDYGYEYLQYTPFFGISSRNHIMLGSNSWHWPYVYTSMQLLEQHSISSKFWAHHFRPYWKFRHHRILGINLSYFIAISVEFDLNFFHITLRWKTGGLRRLHMQYEYDVISPNFHL